MTTIETHDTIDGYMDEERGGRFGQRLSAERRYWLAWASASEPTTADCSPGVMDDFGTLVPVPSPPRQLLH